MLGTSQASPPEGGGQGTTVVPRATRTRRIGRSRRGEAICATLSRETWTSTGASCGENTRNPGENGRPHLDQLGKSSSPPSNRRWEARVPRRSLDLGEENRTASEFSSEVVEKLHACTSCAPARPRMLLHGSFMEICPGSWPRKRWADPWTRQIPRSRREETIRVGFFLRSCRRKIGRVHPHPLGRLK